jgi:hypothetical protein
VSTWRTTEYTKPTILFKKTSELSNSFYDYLQLGGDSTMQINLWYGGEKRQLPYALNKRITYL